MSLRFFRRRLTSGLLFFLVLLVSVLVLQLAETRRSAAEPEQTCLTVILDAGHGGRDSGAVGVNGVLEKNLNLAVANQLASFLRAAGIEVVMTREDDRMLYTEEQDIPGKRKYYDLENRRRTAEMHPDALFVSIHMNRFGEEKYKGLQVWCAEDDESRRLASLVSERVRVGLQPENNRKVKTAGKEIYLLDRAAGVAILIECGFLSNSEECALLSDEDYRRELSFLIFCGIMNYLDGASETSLASARK